MPFPQKAPARAEHLNVDVYFFVLFLASRAFVSLRLFKISQKILLKKCPLQKISHEIFFHCLNSWLCRYCLCHVTAYIWIFFLICEIFWLGKVFNFSGGKAIKHSNSCKGKHRFTRRVRRLTQAKPMNGLLSKRTTSTKVGQKISSKMLRSIKYACDLEKNFR